MQHSLGLGWGVTGLGWVYHFIRLLCGTIISVCNDQKWTDIGPANIRIGFHTLKVMY